MAATTKDCDVAYDGTASGTAVANEAKVAAGSAFEYTCTMQPEIRRGRPARALITGIG